MNDFAALILTHGRPNKVKTYETLKKQGYTGRIVIVIDNEDQCADEYYAKYGNQVEIFDKKEIAKTFDEGDNFNNRKAIIYARNASFEIARKIGVTYFIQLDDDYTSFVYKFNSDLVYQERKIKNLDKLFEYLVEYYKSIPALTIAIAQNGDFIGGKNSKFAKQLSLKRKCMNTFICSVDRPFNFFGRINEDVNTYTNLGSKGLLLLTIPNVAIIQIQTQQNKGGMTETYLDGGTYLKSFYTVLYSPSCVKIGEMGDKHKRLHHKIKWNNAVPMILDEQYQKYNE
jgi:hypothetical protein